MDKDMHNAKGWLDEAWEDVVVKLRETRNAIGVSFPHKSLDGKYLEEGLHWWTNGFWPGLMWMMYEGTGDEAYRTIAEGCEEKLDEAFNEHFDRLHHDVGFMWLHSAVFNYRFTGNEVSRRRGLIAASYLASRFNIRANYIRAWNWDMVGWSIIDSMMNIPILFWASDQTEDPRFRFIGEAHADKVLEHFIREDGSVRHIVVFDPYTGDFVESLTGQGYGPESAWTRGQAWALHGFALAYAHTGHERYLAAAKRVAHYFIANLPEDCVPQCDFRAPKEGDQWKDVSAGACAACGLLEIEKHVPEHEKKLYRTYAEKMLESLYRNYFVPDVTEEGLLSKGTIAYNQNDEEKNKPLIYGDYYFVEGLRKLMS